MHSLEPVDELEDVDEEVDVPGEGKWKKARRGVVEKGTGQGSESEGPDEGFGHVGWEGRGVTKVCALTRAGGGTGRGHGGRGRAWNKRRANGVEWGGGGGSSQVTGASLMTFFALLL